MTEELIKRAERTLSEWEASSRFLSQHYIEGVIESAVRDAVMECQSPWVDRAGAAARWRCSESEIDRASKAGILTRLERCETPLFEKAQGDEAIRSGSWKLRTLAKAA